MVHLAIYPDSPPLVEGNHLVQAVWFVMVLLAIYPDSPPLIEGDHLVQALWFVMVPLAICLYMSIHIVSLYIISIYLCRTRLFCICVNMMHQICQF